jgi:hypothetical protein
VPHQRHLVLQDGLGGVPGGALVLAAGDLAEQCERFGGGVIDRLPAGGAEQRAIGVVVLAAEVLQLVGVDLDPASGGDPGRSGGAQLGGAAEQGFGLGSHGGDGGHGGTRGRAEAATGAGSGW